MTRSKFFLGSMAVVEDAALLAQASSWVRAATHGFTQVRSFVPDVFDDYARIFHPAMREAEERDLPLRAPGESKTGLPVYPREYDVPWCEVRWEEIAEANGKVAHPAMQWPSITAGCDLSEDGTQPGLWERAPQGDSLPLRHTRVLCEILDEFTRTPELCWCAVWEGYGHMIGLRNVSMLPRLKMSNRAMIVACGPLSAVPEKSFVDEFTDPSKDSSGWQTVESYRSPSLWWPNDRAWCVATDIDMQVTYVGASTTCVDRLLEDQRLEVMRVSADQDITYEADATNPLPPPHATTD
jgi:hypothetical protein